MANTSLGLGLVLLAGVLNGSFAAPTKFASRWKWENIWMVWSVVALFLAPWVLVFGTISAPFSFYRNGGIGILLLLFGFGAGFGLSQILFGLALAAVGLSLGFAITVGLSTAVGSLVPLVILQSQTLRTPKGMMILAGVGSILVGITLCAVAGREKEKSALSTVSTGPGAATQSKSFKMGLLLCLLAGLGSPLVNFGLAFGTPLLSRAAQLGLGSASQANVVWAPLLSAALIPYLAYCFYLCSRNRTWHLFVLRGTGSHWLLGAAMGLLWMTSVALYGTASAQMAAMGPILGWPLFMSVIIVTANVWGLMTGEWAGIRRGPITLMLVGILFLILGFCFVAFGSRLA